MNNPKISIIIPVKNTAGFLKECLDSIISQTFKDWELIAIDDNSTDNSYDTLVSYAQKDNRIKVLKNSQHGIITALQLAYEYSTGKFFTRMDSDDIMEPNKLKLLLSQLQLKGSGHIAVGLVNYFSNTTLGQGYLTYANWLNKLTSAESNFSEIYKECTIPSPCWMVDRADFEACGGFNSNVYPEDYDLAFRFRKGGLKIAAVKEVIHRWRDYESRTSRTDANYADNRFAKLKVMHFLDQDYEIEESLVLWGAGKKGKKIARLLVDNNVQFQWVSNNPKKIGRDIYSVILQDMSSINRFGKAQIIIALSSPDAAVEIREMIKINPSQQYFRFY